MCLPQGRGGEGEAWTVVMPTMSCRSPCWDPGDPEPSWGADAGLPEAGRSDLWFVCICGAACSVCVRGWFSFLPQNQPLGPWSLEAVFPQQVCLGGSLGAFDVQTDLCPQPGGLPPAL